MAWIESHQALGAHPKTLKLSRLLRISRVQAVGHLHYLWWWATDYAQDGDLTRYDTLDIAVASFWEGDEDTFVHALVQAGFLDRVDDSLVIHDWDEFAGRLIERRAKNAQRMREARAAQNPTQDESCDERAAHVQSTIDARARQPNQTKPNHTKPNQTKPDEEHSARSAPVRVSYPDDFEQFWKEYPSGNGSKKAAYEQWRKLKPDEDLRLEIMHGLSLWNRSDRWQRGYVKDSARWLRDQLWMNPPPQNGAVQQTAKASEWQRKHNRLLAIANGEA